jgi:hypothetical protein
VVEDLDGAVRAVERAAELDRRRCRQIFERRFSAARMAEDYLRVYRRLVEGRPSAGAVRRPRAGGGPSDGGYGSPRVRVRPRV